LDLTTTLIVFGTSVILFAVASWRAKQPAQFGKVRMVPWTTLIIVFAVIAIFMLVHLVNLAGFKTGQR
jgi:multisubunit Na+/H+ antiporter MnhB subunit